LGLKVKIVHCNIPTQIGGPRRFPGKSKMAVMTVGIMCPVFPIEHWMGTVDTVRKYCYQKCAGPIVKTLNQEVVL
jgi:hypothetical protein